MASKIGNISEFTKELDIFTNFTVEDIITNVTVEDRITNKTVAERMSNSVLKHNSKFNSC